MLAWLRRPGPFAFYQETPSFYYNENSNSSRNFHAEKVVVRKNAKCYQRVVAIGRMCWEFFFTRSPRRCTIRSDPALKVTAYLLTFCSEGDGWARSALACNLSSVGNCAVGKSENRFSCCLEQHGTNIGVSHGSICSPYSRIPQLKTRIKYVIT